MDLRRVHEGIRAQVVGREEEAQLLLAALAAGRDLLLEGPPGTSKSTILRAVASLNGTTLRLVEGNADLTPAKLVGHHSPSRVLKEDYNPDNFVHGPLPLAMRDGGLLYIEELNRVPEDTLNALLSAMAERELAIPRAGTVRAEPGFRVVAAMNPFDNIGTARLGGAITDRLCRVRMGYQPEGEERDIVSRRTGSADAWLVRLAVRAARLTREHPDLRMGASVRAAIDFVLIAEQLAMLRGVTPSLAPGDEDARRALVAAAQTAFSIKISVREASRRAADEIVEEVVDAALAELAPRRTAQMTRDPTRTTVRAKPRMEPVTVAAGLDKARAGPARRPRHAGERRAGVRRRGGLRRDEAALGGGEDVRVLRQGPPGAGRAAAQERRPGRAGGGARGRGRRPAGDPGRDGRPLRPGGPARPRAAPGARARRSRGAAQRRRPRRAGPPRERALRRSGGGAGPGPLAGARPRHASPVRRGPARARPQAPPACLRPRPRRLGLDEGPGDLPRLPRACDLRRARGAGPLRRRRVLARGRRPQGAPRGRPPGRAPRPRALAPRPRPHRRRARPQGRPRRARGRRHAGADRPPVQRRPANGGGAGGAHSRGLPDPARRGDRPERRIPRPLPPARRPRRRALRPHNGGGRHPRRRKLLSRGVGLDGGTRPEGSPVRAASPLAFEAERVGGALRGARTVRRPGTCPALRTSGRR
ncbi:AAA domain-containing protein [Rubrobacter marinus]|uniref:AAA domain-containing protein n=1 Tax=Rubrobacter marinus TaxID=2653852 RepID=A0A6G8Q2Y0_9ACTN|nr:AAA domain-containing protein [Rubrobacter marinus]